MKYKYTAIGAVVGLLLPSFLIVFFARLWGVEITDKETAAIVGGILGFLSAVGGFQAGKECDEISAALKGEGE